MDPRIWIRTKMSWIRNTGLQIGGWGNSVPDCIHPPNAALKAPFAAFESAKYNNNFFTAKQSSSWVFEYDGTLYCRNLSTEKSAQYHNLHKFILAFLKLNKKILN